MSRWWLLRKEVTWSRHQLLPLVLVLLILPTTAAYTALGFQHVLPKDTPVAVVGEEDTDDDALEVVEAALTTFSDPVRYESTDRARAAMRNERVYAVVSVPPGLFNESANVTITMYRDGDMVPYEQPGLAVASILQGGLRRLVPAEVHVNVVETGGDRTLSEYLIPTFVLIVLTLLSLAYLPYALVDEASVVDRVRFESSLGAVVAGKLATFTVLGVVPLGVAAVASDHIGYDLTLLAPGAILAYALTMVYTGAFAAAVTVISRFRTWGRLANLAMLLGLLTFSGIVYPVGFFSAVRRDLVRLVPMHYSVIAVRGHVLKGQRVSELATEYGVMLATTAVCLALLWASIRHYERGA